MEANETSRHCWLLLVVVVAMAISPSEQQPQLAQVSLLNGGGQARQQQPLAQVNIGNRQPLAQVSLGGQQQQQPLAQVNVGGSGGGGGGIDLDLNPSMKDFVGFSYSRASRNPPSPRFIQFLNKVRLNRSQSSLFSMQNLLQREILSIFKWVP